MPKKSKVILNPWLNAYTYDVFRKATSEQKVNLSGKYLKYAKKDTTANHFAATADIEDRAIFLAKMNIPFAWVFGPLDNKNLNELYKEYKESGQAKALSTMMEQGLFVVTNREIMRLLGIMASNCHTETYLLNRTYHKAGYHIRKWKTEIDHPSSASSREGLTSSKEVAKIMYNSVLMAKDTQGFAGITDCAMCVLQYLYSRESNDVLESDIRGKMQPMFQPAKVALGFKKLLECQYVEKYYRKDKKPSFSITGLGIDIAMKFQKRILTFTFNF